MFLQTPHALRLTNAKNAQDHRRLQQSRRFRALFVGNLSGFGLLRARHAAHGATVCASDGMNLDAVARDRGKMLTRNALTQPAS